MNFKASFLKRTPALSAALALAALTFAAYALMVHDSFKTMDDYGSIVANEWIRHPRYLKEIFTSSFFGRKAYYRPMVHVSFMIDYHLFGLRAFYYYLVNLSLHAANALLVFAIMRRLLPARAPAFLAALLFAIHPINWEPVCNIPGRSILLCGFFLLITFALFQGAGRGKIFQPAAWLAFGAALLCKESAAVFPMILLAYCLLPGTGPVPGPGPDSGLGSARAQAAAHNGRGRFTLLAPSLPFFFLTGAYLIWRRALGITRFFYWNSLEESLLGFLTFLRSLITFARLLVWPLGLIFDRSQALFTGWAEPGALGTLAFFSLLALGLFQCRRKLPAVAWFLIFWAALEFAPVSQLVVSIGVQPGRISSAEHFIYMPSVALFGLAALGAGWLERVNEREKALRPVFLRTALAGFLLFLFLTSVGQSLYSSNEVAMFERTLELSPENVRIRNSLAFAYAKLNRFEEAEFHFRRALRSVPDDAWALVGLGKALCDQGKFWEGLAVYERIADAGGLQRTLDENIRATYRLLAELYESRLEAREEDAALFFSLGVVYSKQGREEEALSAYRQALARDPGMKNALFNLGSLLEARGQKQEAVAYYERLLNLPGEKDDVDAFVRGRLIHIYDSLGQPPGVLLYNDLP